MPYLSKLRNKEGKKDKERIKEMKTYHFHEIYFYKPDKSITKIHIILGGKIRKLVSRHESSTSDHLINLNILKQRRNGS
jgi:hypothetical protein